MDSPEIEKIIKRLGRNSQLSSYTHFGAAERMSQVHLLLGVPIAIISVAIGSVLVADIQNEVPVIVKWVGGVLSLISALLASLQTIFNPKEGKSKHREIANNYLSINRKLEHLMAKLKDGIKTPSEISSELDNINKEYDSVNSQADDYPTVDKDWKRAKRKIQGIDKYNKENSKK